MTLQNPLSAGSGLSPLSLVRMLWKQKLYLVLSWLLITAISALVIYKLPAVYKAETLILVDSQKIPEKYVTATVNAELQDRLATISQQILSSTRLQKIIETFGLYKQQRKNRVQEEIIEMMREDIQIKLEKGWTKDRPGAFRIAYQGPEPAVVAAVANQMGNFFIEENLRAREVQAEGTSEFINSQLQQAKKSLDEQESKLSRYKLGHYGELPQQEQSLNATLSRLQIQLQGNQDAINRGQQTKLMLENTLNIAEATEAALTRNAQQAAAAKAAAAIPGTAPGSPPPPPKKKSALLLAELENLRTRYSDDHPEVKRMQADLARLLRTEQREAQEAPDPGPHTALVAQPSQASNSEPTMATEALQALVRERERVEQVKAQLALAARDLEVRAQEQQNILRLISTYQARVERLPLREQEMAGVTRDYEISRANYKSLLDKKLAAEMATELEKRQKAERFTVLDPARVPEKPFQPNRPLLSALASLAGLVIGIAIAIGKEFKKNTFLGEWELPPDTVVLGRVARIRIAGSRPQRSGRQQAGSERPPVRRWRFALVSGALLSLLAVIAVGFYYGWSRL